jgi:hypothetical protein
VYGHFGSHGGFWAFASDTPKKLVRINAAWTNKRFLLNMVFSSRWPGFLFDSRYPINFVLSNAELVARRDEDAR